MNHLSSFEEILLVLAGLKNQLEPCVRTFKRYGRDHEAKASLSNYLLILVASFDQEWQRLEALGASPTVKRTLVAASPATKRIRAWRGLHRLRSSLLAHGFRDKSRRLVNTSTLYGPEDAPSNFAAQLLLGELAVYAIAVAMCHHGTVASEALAKLRTLWKDEEPESCGIATTLEFDIEIGVVRSEMFGLDRSLESCFAGKLDGG